MLFLLLLYRKDTINYCNYQKKKRLFSYNLFFLPYFNPNSNKQLRHLLYDQLELPIFRYTDTKLPSTDGKTLEGLIKWLEKNYEINDQTQKKL